MLYRMPPMTLPKQQPTPTAQLAAMTARREAWGETHTPRRGTVFGEGSATPPP